MNKSMSDFLSTLVRLGLEAANKVGDDCISYFMGDAGQSYLLGELNRILLKREALVTPLLSLVDCPIYVPKQNSPFIVKDRFKESNAGIDFICDEFHEWFSGQVIESCHPWVLYCRDLNRSFHDQEVIEEITIKRLVIDLTAVFSLISRQSEGQLGALPLQSLSNFYIYDINNELRSVNVRWGCGRGWVITAKKINCLAGYGSGQRVFFGSYSLI